MRPGDYLLHPLVLASIILLVLNDHVLKQTFGNVVTGKLSDVAGVFFLPLLFLLAAELAGVALRRTGWPASRTVTLTAIAVVGAGFAAVKLIPVVGDAYEHMAGLLRKVVTFSDGPVVPIVVVRDGTDVLVLPVLIGAYWLVRRYRGDLWTAAVTSPATRPGPPPHHAAARPHGHEDHDA
ncbi:MAG: hypothetical protein QM621_12470 [Aeromicrobium sp.]|uniref:hypothetical protein n=1 Tax=Aeromicrobium sp. TaxID=1871063 RepID=UPI0039E37060